MITEKQKWARKRNWLILRLSGAKSIFSQENIIFMKDCIKENSFLTWECHNKIDDLIEALREGK